jgi:hypothetical protein
MPASVIEHTSRKRRKNRESVVTHRVELEVVGKRKISKQKTISIFHTLQALPTNRRAQNIEQYAERTLRFTVISDQNSRIESDQNLLRDIFLDDRWHQHETTERNKDDISSR